MAPLVDGLARQVLSATLRRLPEGRLDLVRRGSPASYGQGPGARPDATIVVHDDRAFRRIVTGSDIGLGEAYMDGDWSSPDLVAVLRLAIRNVDLFEERHRWLSAVSRWWNLARHRLRPNTARGSRSNVRRHYDLGNDFYRLFLDESMAYSCAIFLSPDDTLEHAQATKFDRMCRKLQLSPADHVLEIGTGWGGFAAWAAIRYGCRVTTTTISAAQHAAAAERFARLGLRPDRVTLLYEDYRELRGQYAKLVSIEMIEAVGHRNYDAFFGACDRLLAPGGAMALQAITVPDHRLRQYLSTSDWIRKHVFPGGELASVAAIRASLARATRLSLVDAEEIGLHYARTLRAWRERFLARLAEVRALGFDDRFIRMWEYYLALCEAAFLERHIGDVQLVMAVASPAGDVVLQEERARRGVAPFAP